MKALVLHQDVENAKELLRRLQVSDKDCIFVRSRQQARTEILQRRPDVILMNWWGFGSDIITFCFRLQPQAVVVIIDNAPDRLIPKDQQGKAALPVLTDKTWQEHKGILAQAS